MRTIDRRLGRLERRTPERRCTVCRDWPPTRVVHSDPEMASLAEGWAERFAATLPPEAPAERCPTCGWEPLTIVVRYTDDWRTPA